MGTPHQATGTRAVTVQRLDAQAQPKTAYADVLVEEPLEIRVSGETLATTMRTPGHDRELVAGFLLAEGVISSVDDLLSLTHCARRDDEPRNVMEVRLVSGVKPPMDPDTGLLARRGTLTTSACGVCGRRTIEDLTRHVAPLDSRARVPQRLLVEAMGGLRPRQALFAATGGAHAASIVDLEGKPLCTYEDIGRHNAVDKAVGSLLLSRTLRGGDRLLVVSGRASFEIVQKAFVAGIAVVASVSAPSSLAIELAERAQLTLVGFLREDAMTLYTGAARIDRTQR